MIVLGALLVIVALIVVGELIIYVLGGMPLLGRRMRRISGRVTGRGLFRWLARLLDGVLRLKDMALSLLRRLFRR